MLIIGEPIDVVSCKPQRGREIIESLYRLPGPTVTIEVISADDIRRGFLFKALSAEDEEEDKEEDVYLFPTTVTRMSATPIDTHSPKLPFVVLDRSQYLVKGYCLIGDETQILWFEGVLDLREPYERGGKIVITGLPE